MGDHTDEIICYRDGSCWKEPCGRLGRGRRTEKAGSESSEGKAEDERKIFKMTTRKDSKASSPPHTKAKKC